MAVGEVIPCAPSETLASASAATITPEISTTLNLALTRRSIGQRRADR
jgi:hypothetical protein